MTVPMLGGSYEIARGLMSMFNVRSYGAVGNGTVDDTAALQRATDAAAAAGGGVVYFPPGTYRVTSPGVIVKSSVYFEGAGYEISIVYKDETSADFKGALHNADTFPDYFAVDHLSIRNLGFLGTGETQRTSSTSALVQVSADDVTVSGCSFNYARSAGLFIEQSRRAVVTDNRVYRSLADGIAVWSASEVIIAGNVVTGSNDDAISVSFSEYLAGPVTGNVIVANNTVTESQGINLVNVRSCLVTGNVLTRIMGAGVRLVASPDEAAMFGCRVSGNIITDVILRSEPNPGFQAHIGILITGADPRIKTSEGVPGDPTSGTGTVTSLYGPAGIGTLYAPQTGAAYVGRPPAFGVEISDNIMLRTLPAVTTISQWGYGAQGFWVADNGDGTGFYNGAITDAALSFNGIAVDAGFRDCRIERNHIRTGGPVAIDFRNSPVPVDRDFAGLRIVGNKIINFSGYGIRLAQTLSNHRILIKDNEIDGDPLFASANRGANGTFLTAASPIGIASDNSAGALIEDNHFRNLATYLTGGLTTRFITVRDNYLYGQWAAFNFSTSNKGNGTMAASGVRGWVLIVEDSDPTSATYGNVLSDVTFTASSIPTTGTYVRGHVVWNTNPVQSGGKVLLGWARLTSGSAHVLNTDWSALYATTT